MDSYLSNEIRRLANEEGISMNKVIKKLLRQAISNEKQELKPTDTSMLRNTMTEKELERFNSRLDFFEEADLNSWK